ncbi:MAG: hypothetical protein H0U42_03805 [Thermoleophilaceae bacterium]|nr:hypothetical protein [Thermoleophilaceae bacterium]
MDDPTPDRDPRAPIDPERFENPGKAPAMSRKLNVDTGWEIGLPMAVAGGAALFFALLTSAIPLWILGGVLVAVGVLLMARNKRL